VLWYVRLRKVCRVTGRSDRDKDVLGKKGYYSKELLEVNSRYLLEKGMKNEYTKTKVTSDNIRKLLEENKRDTSRKAGNVKDRKNQFTPDEDSDDDNDIDDFKEEVAETRDFIANEAEKLALSMD